MTAQLPSKVRLAQIASFSKSMALPPSHDEIEAMARALLAAYEQELVAIRDENPSFEIMPGESEYDRLKRQWEWMEKKNHAASIPAAVPDEMTIRDACKFVQDMRIFDDVSVIVMRTWNACAMLNHSEQSLEMVNSPVIQEGYVMVPDELLSDLRDFAHPEIEKYCEMWAGRRDEEFPAMRKIISGADAVLAAVPKAIGSQLTPAPGWTGNGDANAALVMLDRIDTLAPEDDDRIEEVKQIIRYLAAPKAPDGWIPVRERMPEFSYWVLVSDEHGDFDIAKPVDLSTGDKCAFRMNDGCIFLATHWQPLPDAPKVKS